MQPDAHVRAHDVLCALHLGLHEHEPEVLLLRRRRVGAEQGEHLGLPCQRRAERPAQTQTHLLLDLVQHAVDELALPGQDGGDAALLDPRALEQAQVVVGLGLRELLRCEDWCQRAASPARRGEAGRS